MSLTIKSTDIYVRRLNTKYKLLYYIIIVILLGGDFDGRVYVTCAKCYKWR